MTNLIIERKTIGELGRHVEVLGLVLLAYLIRITNYHLVNSFPCQENDISSLKKIYLEELVPHSPFILFVHSLVDLVHTSERHLKVKFHK